MFESFEGFGSLSGMGNRPGIIVVDFIKAFTDSNCQLGSNYNSEIKETKLLLYKAREKNLLVVFTTVFYEPHFKDAGHFIQKVPALRILTEHSDWVKIDERLERREESEPLISKKFASAFFGTNLVSLLNSQNIDTTIIVGCTTSGCVRATSVDALQNGYQVIIPQSCVGDRSRAAHEANLYDIQTKYGDVVNLPEVINYLDQMNNH